MAEVSPVDTLLPAVALLGIGTAAALGARALRTSPIVGYLAAGVLIGPHALGVVAESGSTHLLAELGVVFLLFDIGLHVSMRELSESRRDLISLAPMQMAFAGLVFSLILGGVGVDWPIAIAVGMSLALSSTAVVARLLSDRELRQSPLGRTSTNVLIFQDICAIFLLIYANSLASGGDQLALKMALAAGQAIFAFCLALVIGRFVISPLLRALAASRNEEIFTAFTLFLALGAAVATYIAGLSLTLGAFLAGLAVSGTAFRHQIQMETAPFRGLLLSFFFISVGMSVDVPGLIADLPLVLL
ncbi:MAG: cation:proton antiporter, partial [Pseudomonadota bacterium]